MKKSRRKRSKNKMKYFLTIIVIAILAFSVVGALMYWQPIGSNDVQNPTDKPTFTPSSSMTPTFTIITPEPVVSASPDYRIKVLNKSIPADYEFGLTFDAGLTNGMNVLFINNVDQRLSIRFTAKMSGTVKSLVLYTFAYVGEPYVRVGIQDDRSGYPEGEWLEENSYGTLQLYKNTGFREINLGGGASLTEGHVYHVVIEAYGPSFDGVAAVSSYQANGYAQPFNPDDPDIIWDDPQMNTLSFNGADWKLENKWPIFVVRYSNGESEGQPYSIDAQWVVWGSTYVGQTIIPASDYKLGKIAFDVSLGSSGISQGELRYQIRDSSNNILSEGIFSTGGGLTTLQSWVELSLETGVNLVAGELYRIVVLSPGSDLSNAYHFYGHEFCFDPAIGYGSFQHQLTSSLDGGLTWGENSDADAIFRLTTSK